MKPGQDVYLNNISDKFQNGSCQVKNWSLDQILEKPCVRYKGHIFFSVLLKFGQNVCSGVSWISENMGHIE